MKRSAQVALLLGGLTTAGAGAYAMGPVRRDCPAPTPASTAAQGTSAPGLAAPAPGSTAGAAAVPGQRPEDCRPRRRYQNWGWSSGYYDSRGSRSYWPGSSSRNRDATRVNMTPSSGNRSAPRSRPATTTRGGFGSTGRSAGRSSS